MSNEWDSDLTWMWSALHVLLQSRGIIISIHMNMLDLHPVNDETPSFQYYMNYSYQKFSVPISERFYGMWKNGIERDYEILS